MARRIRLKLPTNNIMHQIVDSPGNFFSNRLQIAMSDLPPNMIEAISNPKSQRMSKTRFNQSLQDTFGEIQPSLSHNSPAENFSLLTIRPFFRGSTHVKSMSEEDKKVLYNTKMHLAFDKTNTYQSLPCSLCNKNSNASLCHRILECNFGPIKKARDNFEKTLEGLHLLQHWMPLTHSEQLHIHLGEDWEAPTEQKSKLLTLSILLLQEANQSMTSNLVD